MNSTSDNLVVGVWPLAGFDRILHYRLPAHLAGSAEVGILVRIPILNRHSIGVICEVDSIPDVPREKLKLVTELIYPMPVLTPDLMKLTEWMGRYYGASRESIIEAMMRPSSSRKSISASLATIASVAFMMPR